MRKRGRLVRTPPGSGYSRDRGSSAPAGQYPTRPTRAGRPPPARGDQPEHGGRPVVPGGATKPRSPYPASRSGHHPGRPQTARAVTPASPASHPRPPQVRHASRSRLTPGSGHVGRGSLGSHRRGRWVPQGWMGPGQREPLTRHAPPATHTAPRAMRSASPGHGRGAGPGRRRPRRPTPAVGRPGSARGSRPSATAGRGTTGVGPNQNTTSGTRTSARHQRGGAASARTGPRRRPRPGRGRATPPRRCRRPGRPRKPPPRLAVRPSRTARRPAGRRRPPAARGRRRGRLPPGRAGRPARTRRLPASARPRPAAAGTPRTAAGGRSDRRCTPPPIPAAGWDVSPRTCCPTTAHPSNGRTVTRTGSRLTPISRGSGSSTATGSARPGGGWYPGRVPDQWITTSSRVGFRSHTWTRPPTRPHVARSGHRTSCTFTAPCTANSTRATGPSAPAARITPSASARGPTVHVTSAAPADPPAAGRRVGRTSGVGPAARRNTRADGRSNPSSGTPPNSFTRRVRGVIRHPRAGHFLGRHPLEPDGEHCVDVVRPGRPREPQGGVGAGWPRLKQPDRDDGPPGERGLEPRHRASAARPGRAATCQSRRPGPGPAARPSRTATRPGTTPSGSSTRSRGSDPDSTRTRNAAAADASCSRRSQTHASRTVTAGFAPPPSRQRTATAPPPPWSASSRTAPFAAGATRWRPRRVATSAPGGPVNVTRVAGTSGTPTRASRSAPLAVTGTSNRTRSSCDPGPAHRDGVPVRPAPAGRPAGRQGPCPASRAPGQRQSEGVVAVPGAPDGEPGGERGDRVPGRPVVGRGRHHRVRQGGPARASSRSRTGGGASTSSRAGSPTAGVRKTVAGSGAWAAAGTRGVPRGGPARPDRAGRPRARAPGAARPAPTALARGWLSAGRGGVCVTRRTAAQPCQKP